MVIEYSLPRISFISSYIIANKTLILYLCCKRRSWSHMVKKKEINTAIVYQTWKSWILQ